MAKTESTAVNDLISAVQSRAIAPQSSPGDDLFASPQRTSVIPATNTLSPSPASTTLGMAPLSRSRTPSGTRENAVNLAPPAPAPVLAPAPAAPARAATVPPPARAATIPPPVRAAEGTPAPELLGPPSAAPRTPPSPTLLGQGKSPLAALQAAPPPPAAPLPPPPAPVFAPLPQVQAHIPSPPILAPASARPSAPHNHTGVDRTGDAVAADGWFEASRAVDRVEMDDDISGTLPVQRQARGNKTHKLIAWGVVGAVVVVLFGGYLMFDGSGGKKHTAAAATRTAAAEPASGSAQPNAEQIVQPGNSHTPTAEAAAAPAQPAPAAADPSAQPAPAAAAPTATATTSDSAPAGTSPAAPGKLVDVRIDSKPAGATVMLVDNGKTSFLGNTPVSATVDPSRMYDVDLHARRPADADAAPRRQAHQPPRADVRPRWCTGGRDRDGRDHGSRGSRGCRTRAGSSARTSPRGRGEPARGVASRAGASPQRARTHGRGRTRERRWRWQRHADDLEQAALRDLDRRQVDRVDHAAALDPAVGRFAQGHVRELGVEHPQDRAGRDQGRPAHEADPELDVSGAYVPAM